MSLVGGFPGLNELRRRTVRAPTNPMDKATVVSIYPKRIDEFKATIQPGRFILEPGSYEKPSILVVGPSSWWREIDEEQPLLEIPISSIQIADSIVRDYCNGVFACNMGDKMPGMFYVPGEHTVEAIVKNYKKTLDEYNVRQRNFYRELLMLGDALWARSNGNPMAISEDMRLAARELGVEKDWTKDFALVAMVKCFACGALKNPEYPVCAACRAIDSTHPRAKDIKFA